MLPALLFVCIARLWLMPLGSSFWVDEMGTAFVVRHAAQDPSLRAVPQVPASIYYWLPRLSSDVFGYSETAYRLPSALALGLALWLVARIAGRLIHPGAGWFAAFACLSLRGFNYQAADARPYALGTLVAAGAFWFLIRWLDRGRWSDAALFTLAAAVLWRVHLVFWPLYAAFALYAAVRLARADTPAGWRQALTVLIACCLSLAPVLMRALSLYRNAGAHVIAPLPSAMDLARSLKPGLVAACALVGALLGRRVGRGPAAGASLILGWWLIPPLALFAFSWATAHSVFVHRYVDVALPGAALAATAAAGVFLPPARWRPASALLGAAVLLLLGGWNHWLPVHHNSGWREAADRIEPGMPVVCPSPFIEARPPVWRPHVPAAGFLYAHLEAYPIHGTPYAFPYEISPEAERFAAGLVRGTLAPAGRFAIYGQGSILSAWRDWFRACPELAGWRDRSLGPFGDVDVIVFERPPGPAVPSGGNR
ncbi:MAG TPA: glycosyltransferase family 39 protein [Bryobacteraceae bacterium]|nr:glycosyltransferase family 39 protein [Bryobacteraceae bacterium]